MTDQNKFLQRVGQAMKKSNIVKFYLGKNPVYIVAGAQNMQVIFSSSHKIGNEDLFAQHVLPKLYGMPKHEVDRFARDKTGRGKIPVPGAMEQTDQRYWYTEHHIHNEYMGRSQYLSQLSRHYLDVLNKTLDSRQPVKGQWDTVSLTKLCRDDMTSAAIETLVGPRIFELNPGFIEMFWDFDSIIFPLVLGLPSWMNPRPTRVRGKWNDMIRKYLDSGLENFDWNGPDVNASWEPVFGARVCRELVRWLLDSNFCTETVGGFLGTFLWAQNSNSIPIATWALVELVRVPSLFTRVREEVRGAETIDPDTASRTLDISKLLLCPLLQAVFTETLRLHMSFNVLRQVKQPVIIDGHKLQQGAMLQAPMQVAHYDESWAVENHPADEFWPERHIRYKDEKGEPYQKPIYSIGGRPSSYFPFGGGVSICPGRQFAKNEMLITLGLIVSKFDLELVEWTNLDGSPSDRSGRNDKRFAGGGAMPPDRDMKVRWRRLW